MGKQSNKKSKREALRGVGALNSHPERVVDRLFKEHPFFDPEDKAQVKYEMLRRREVEDEQLQDACGRFGFTRESYRQILMRFRSEGLLGLFDRKRGRQGPVKLTDKVRLFLHHEHERHPELNVDELVHRCEEETGVLISRRSAYRALSELDPGEQKKKRLCKTSYKH